MLQQLDLNILLLVNALVGKSVTVDHIIYSLNNDNSFSGFVVFLMFGIVWFRETDEKRRVYLLAGLLGTCLLTGLSVAWQTLGHVHLRPVLDVSLGLRIPEQVNPRSWLSIGHPNSFPSDTTTLFFALASLVATMDLRLGIVTLIWTAVVVAFPRIYLTYHYPSDVLGGIVLGCCAPLLARARPLLGPCRALVQRLRGREYLINALALCFFIELSTMFVTVRLVIHSLNVFAAHHGFKIH